jgi:SAM-dependent methyltransferase
MDEPEQIPQTPELTEDDGTEDDGYFSCNQSLCTAVASSCFEIEDENGRKYSTYGFHKPVLPCDEAERFIWDLIFAVEKQLNLPLFHSPTSTPQWILDLGAGTGEWGCAVADAHGEATVVGLDNYYPFSSSLMPPNFEFQICDIEMSLSFSNQFDLVVARHLTADIRDWKLLAERIFELVKPGGWVEFSGITLRPLSDDGSIREGSHFLSTWEKMVKCAKNFGLDLEIPDKFMGLLQQTGFTDVEQHMSKIPCSTWPKNPDLKLAGKLFRHVITEGASARALRLFYPQPAYQTEIELTGMKDDVRDTRQHQYCYR